MDHKTKIIKELEAIAPNLASLKNDIDIIDVSDTYFDDLVTKTIAQEKPSNQGTQIAPTGKIKYIQLLTMAASIALLVGIWIVFQNNLETFSVEETYAEAYMTDNLEEFDEYIIDELSEFGFDDQILEDISDESIITYIEDNLDDLDLEYFYD